ncbi:RNA polymerase sigma factor [Sphingosinicella terrae]|uniref:RNA polymerase sigma factor n=1 Tax=Sphingosinicella terrae TaxID=2172047 RepID=UPI000E0CE8DF|nr:sigma factor-like helix-turn-helix DNA-binding protein [Sphingosinicella terrae]
MQALPTIRRDSAGTGAEPRCLTAPLAITPRADGEGAQEIGDEALRAGLERRPVSRRPRPVPSQQEPGMPDYPSPFDRTRIERAAARLPPLEWEVLRLAAAEDLANDAIAARLGIAVAEVERLLAQALVDLDHHLRRQARPWWRFW